MPLNKDTIKSILIQEISIYSLVYVILAGSKIAEKIDELCMNLIGTKSVFLIYSVGKDF